MTINIALVTNENIVFGCDSISSAKRSLVDPFGLHKATDSDGNTILDSEGNPAYSIPVSDINDYVVSVFSGVEKMFPVYENIPELSVAATTSGLASIKGQSIRALSDEFRIGPHAQYTSVNDVAKAFLAWFRQKYESEFEGSELPPEYWTTLNFMVGGISNIQSVPSLYRVYVKENEIHPVFVDGTTGVAWDGQSDGVERLIGGCDSQLRDKVERQVEDLLHAQREEWTSRVIEIVDGLLDHFGADQIPPELDTALPPAASCEIPWESAATPIPYSSLPLQYAIDFVGFLVTLQSGRHRFTSNIATVGGRTHIGVVRKGHNFLMLDEPQLTHSMRGFSDDA